jgi:hypothetical protein
MVLSTAGSTHEIPFSWAKHRFVNRVWPHTVSLPLMVVPDKVVDPPTLRVRWTVSAETVTSPETLRLLLTKTLDPEIVVAVRFPRVVRPVTLRILLTVVDPSSVVVESTLSPPLEYSDDPEIVDA